MSFFVSDEYGQMCRQTSNDKHAVKHSHAIGYFCLFWTMLYTHEVIVSPQIVKKHIKMSKKYKYYICEMSLLIKV